MMCWEHESLYLCMNRTAMHICIAMSEDTDYWFASSYRIRLQDPEAGWMKGLLSEIQFIPATPQYIYYAHPSTSNLCPQCLISSNNSSLNPHHYTVMHSIFTLFIVASAASVILATTIPPDESTFTLFLSNLTLTKLLSTKLTLMCRLHAPRWSRDYQQQGYHPPSDPHQRSMWSGYVCLQMPSRGP